MKRQSIKDSQRYIKKCKYNPPKCKQNLKVDIPTEAYPLFTVDD
jgi:hypothetical protein